MKEMDEEAPWQIDLRHVEVEEQKSPSPEEKKRAPPPEFERTPYTFYQKRERPEVMGANLCVDSYKTVFKRLTEMVVSILLRC